ncbi:MAG: DUF4292 domain-containing protein [Chitinophagaceae bacterium]
MKYCLWLVLSVALVAGLDSCRSAKKIQTAIAKKDTTQTVVVPPVEVRDLHADSMRYIHDVLGAIQKNRLDFTTFSAKVKVDFKGGDGKSSDFNAFLRVKKDSAIWVSIIAALGIEAFKVIITPDSVKVLDKLEKRVQLRSLEYLQEVTHIPFTFSELQDLLVGNLIYLDSNIVSYRKQEKSVSLISVGSLFKHLLTVNNTTYLPEHSKLDDVGVIQARTCDITYGDYETKNGFRFSKYRRITVSEKSKLDIELQYKQYDFNVVLEFPFKIPKNYKRQ